VALLPFLGEEDLYRQYKLDEPWDSEHNRKLLEQEPDVFRRPREEPTSVDTSYFVPSGEGTMFAGAEGTPIDAVTDGPANTALIVESVRKVPWTKPEDIAFDPAGPLPPLGGVHEKLFLATFVDGSTRGFPTDYDPAKLKAIMTPRGGEPVDLPKPPGQ
jgi:hypothetical protein